VGIVPSLQESNTLKNNYNHEGLSDE
jgi:hypothetical protein